MIQSKAKVILLILGFLATIQLAMQISLSSLQLNIPVSKSINIPVVPDDDFENESLYYEKKVANLNLQEIDMNLYAINMKNLNIRTRAQKIIDSIPEKDLGDYILYQLSKALNSVSSKARSAIKLPNSADIPYDKYVEFENMKTYNGFSEDLLAWTKNFLETNDDGIHDFLRTKRACPPWGCFDPNDIGEMCCPF